MERKLRERDFIIGVCDCIILLKRTHSFFIIKLLKLLE